MLYVEIAIVVVLVCVNGLLAMSELAIVSSRPARLKAMIDREVKGAGRALALGANPGRFLSTVQIGITLVGVLSGAFSGATLGERLCGFAGRSRHALGSAQPARRRRRGGAHHLRLADHRRTGAQADRAAQSRGGALRMVAPAMTILAKVAAAAGLPARLFRPRRAVAARPARRERGEGHRRGDQDAGRRGRASRHHRIGRAAHDRRRHAARRPRGARRDDAAHRSRLAQLAWPTKPRPARC